jgi:uncharacterized membrane protein
MPLDMAWNVRLDPLATAPVAKRMQRTLGRIGRWIFWLLILIGILSSLSRYILPHDLHARVARVVYGPYTQQLPVIAARPVFEAVHRVGGALYLVIGVSQFMPKLRARHLRLHRWLGRVFLLLTVLVAVGGAFMAVRFPYSGLQEAVPVVLFAAILLYSGYRAYRHARLREIAKHREWAMRAFSVGLGVATIRVFYVVMIYTTDLPARECFNTSIWLGFMLTLLAAEVWINLTRPERSAAGTPAAR